ncbi:MAG TPA: hypothetical protein VNB49_12100, partial [Candidatus Dormibacteraeota bacterium]|nr:hypothetical protein [Candidatus Dormibacteraeota bacterium]
PGLELKMTRDRFVGFWTGLMDPWQAFLRANSLLVRVILVCSTVTALGALLGIAALFWKRSPYLFPIATYPAVYPWLYYLTHSNLRYRHPIDPVVLLLLAMAVGSVLKLSPKAHKTAQEIRPDAVLSTKSDHGNPKAKSVDPAAMARYCFPSIA